MKTNSKIQSTRRKKKIKSGIGSDPQIHLSGSSSLAESKTPDYSSMYAEVIKISHPVPFEELKEFYGLD